MLQGEAPNPGSEVGAVPMAGGKVHHQFPNSEMGRQELTRHAGVPDASD